MFLNKRGQGGGDAAILLVVVTLVLVFYLLLIPPSERQEILDPENTTDDVDDPDEEVRETLLSQNIGQLQYIGRDTQTYNLQSFRVNTETEGETIKQQNSLNPRNSAFQTETASMTFQVSPSQAQNVVLAANVQEGVGRLTVTLNNETIYQGEVTNGNLPNIYIDQESLEFQNTITFSVDSPGIAFWRINEYNLQNIKVSGEVTDISNSENSQSFNIEPDVLNNYDSAVIRYAPSCQRNDDIERYTVSINNREIFRGTPDCNIINQYTVSEDQLREGQNVFGGTVRRGDVLIDNPELRINLESPDTPINYFTLTDRHFTYDEENDEYVLKEGRDIQMSFRFPSVESRRLEAVVNGYVVGINTRDTEVSRNISTYVEPGTNSIEIRPKQEMTITELRVERR